MNRLLVSALCLVLLGHVSYATGDAADPEPTKPTDPCQTAEKQKAFHDCFDELKKDMMSPPLPADVNEFLCSDPHKERLECVIKALAECPSYLEKQEVKAFKDAKSDLSAKDLKYVSSADEFCKCAPTHGCLKKIETSKLGTELSDAPWNKLANMEYICGIGRKHIDCVANSLPGCSRYLQNKFNKSMAAYMQDYYDVSGLEFAAVFAEAHCKKWPNDKVNNGCPEKRVQWLSVEKCYGYALNYKDEEQRQCGLRKCVEKAMISCPTGSMEFFIDSVNVFGEYKITRQPCTISASSVPLATLTSLLLTLYVSLFL